MCGSDWHWLDNHRNPVFHLSEDGREILADYVDYEETYMPVPQSRQEFDELDPDTQNFIRQFVGLFPWELSSKRPSNIFKKLLLTLIILVIIILISLLLKS